MSKGLKEDRKRLPPSYAVVVQSPPSYDDYARMYRWRQPAPAPSTHCPSPPPATITPSAHTLHSQTRAPSNAQPPPASSPPKQSTDHSFEAGDLPKLV